MLEDAKGYLWISTDNGISRLDPADLKFYNYDRSDGLVCKQFNANSACVDTLGNFYFGGYNGIVVFNPDNIFQNTIAPGVRFLGLSIFNKEVGVDPANGILAKDINFYEELTLAYDQDVFSINFSVLNFINPEKNQFAYKLEGFDDRWNYTSEPTATYMNLEPGHYTLLVKGSNNDGVWNENPISIRLNVTPPPWKSWWAYTLYTFAIVGLFVMWSRFNRKKLKLEHELEIEHLELKKQEEIHQAKLSFFANIIHEIRTPLTLMIGPVERVLTDRSRDQQLKKELSLVRMNTDRLQRLLNQLLDFHKQETGNVQLKVQEENIVEFIDEIRVSFKDYANSRKVALEFYSCATDIPLWFDPEELSKVFYNLLVYAFKFTPGGGTK
jgi:signal transduction histidine kinase